MSNAIQKRFFCLLLALGTALALLACGGGKAAKTGGILINEVVSSNKRSLIDEAVGSPDWVELYNASGETVDLSGYGLSDNLRNLHKYVFGDVSIGPGEYLIVYCGDNNGVTKTDVPCTGFGLSKSGDYLFLTDPYYGVVQQMEIPELYTDVSFARQASGNYGFCAAPTPGAANSEPIASSLNALFADRTGEKLEISEVLPSGDESGYPWVELHNIGKSAVQLEDYYLSDSEANLMRFQLPAAVLDAGAYACVYLSGLGSKATSGIHTDFKLGSLDTCVLLSDLQGKLISRLDWEQNLLGGVAVVKTENEEPAYTAFPTFEKENSTETFTDTTTKPMDPSDPVHVSEVLKKNGASAIDMDGDRSEWVELVNRSGTGVSLHGYFLSDDETNLYKWALPDVELPAGGYVMIFLSGKDRREGELHASFRLGQEESALYFSTIDGMKTENIPLSGVNRDDVSVGTDPEGNIRYYAQPTPGSANAQGFTTADEIGCFNPEGIFISEVCGVTAPKSGKNDWVELHNGAAEAVDLSGWYLSDDPDEPKKWQISSLTIPAGDYGVIEATSHATRQTENVATFGIGGGGETLVLSDTNGVPVDRFTTGALSDGVTSGRIETDATVDRVFFSTPTRGEKNDPAGAAVGYAPEPALSETGLYHKEPFAVTVICRDPGATVRYTTDGSEPTYRSALYEGPVTIEDNTVLRAASFMEGRMRSPIAMATYLFDEPHTVPVVCVNGNPNRVNEVMRVDDKDEKVERAALISFYETDGTLGITFPAGIKPKGAGTVAYRQKSLSLNIRGGYGQSSVTYPFFPGYEFSTFSALVVRNGGQDLSCARMRDAFCSRLVEGMHVDNSATRTVVVYVNGEYNGLYDLGEDQNSEFLATHYGIDGDTVDFIRRNTTVISGGNADIKRVQEYALNTDLSDDAKFQEFCQWIDVDYFTDYFIAQTYLCNSDMFNQKYWRTQDYAVKWRPVFYDLDFGFKNSASREMIGQYFNEKGVPSADGSLTYFDIYIGLKKNAGWREKCFERYVECIMTYFNEERATAILDELAETMRPEMPRQIKKWGQPDTMREWEQNVASLRKTVTDRPAYALDQIRHYFGFSQAELDSLIEKYRGGTAE